MKKQKQKTSIKTVDSYRIDFEKAVRLVLGFLTQKELFDIATKAAIGGTIEPGTINPPPTKADRGCMSWICRTENDFFLAIEDGEYNRQNVPLEPKSTTLKRSSQTFRYPYAQPSEDDVIKMLTVDKWPLSTDLDITKSEVLQLINRTPSDYNKFPYNNYPCSFFENRLNRELTNFIEKNPGLVAVRYFFGYDNSDKKYFDSNRIRVVLFGVDRIGRNIVPSITMPSDSVWILEQSWPPPPPVQKKSQI
jgi:hypothetical protein